VAREDIRNLCLEIGIKKNPTVSPARWYLRKVIIPGAKAHEIEASLSVAGIDEVTIFPDLDGLGRFLTSVLRDESMAWLVSEK
jgi:hypothetical protein